MSRARRRPPGAGAARSQGAAALVGGTGPPSRINGGPADTVRIVTNDFMLTGGDGYTVFAGATDVQQPGDGLLEIAVD